MRELERLPPDQRAVLSLVLDQGKSFGEVAALLGMSERSVRERAHTALDTLAGEARPAAAAAVGALASEAAASRAPAATAVAAPTASTNGSSSAPPPPSPARGRQVSRVAPSSRTGGALLLGGILAAIVVAVILISGTSGRKGSGHGAPAASKATPTTSTSAGGASGPKVDKVLALAPTAASSKAAGLAYVFSQSGRHGFYVAAKGMAPSSGFFYAVWLYDSPSSSVALGRAPNVGSNGILEGGGELPASAGRFHRLIVTRETNSHPTTPGPIVLSGAFALR